MSAWLIDDTFNNLCLGTMMDGFAWVPYESRLAVACMSVEAALRLENSIRARCPDVFDGRTVDVVEHKW